MQQEIVPKDTWNDISEKAFKVFKQGQQLSKQQGLILVDTKYEFGLYNGNITLIDEVHTADSSRYFYADEYEERLKNNQPQKQLSKEFLREWLMDHDFHGMEGQTLPDLPDELRIEVYQRYAELFKQLTGNRFRPTSINNFDEQIADIFEPYLE